MTLSGVDFGLAMLSDALDDARNWLSLQASATGVTFTGVTGLTLSASNVSVEINQAANDASLVNYATQSLTVATGPATDITLNMDAADGELLRASGTLNLNLFNFFQVTGDFAIEKSSDTVSVYNGTTNADVSVDLLTIGGHDVSAFAGLNGGTANQLGLSLTGVDFALALLSETTATPRQWVSLQATANDVTFVGIAVDGVNVDANTLGIEINHAATDGSFVNYAAQPLTVATGPTTTLTLTMDATHGELLRASGNLTLELYNFFYVNGGFVIEKSSRTVKV